jgi:hypothetical protein
MREKLNVAQAAEPAAPAPEPAAPVATTPAAPASVKPIQPEPTPVVTAPSSEPSNVATAPAATPQPVAKAPKPTKPKKTEQQQMASQKPKSKSAPINPATPSVYKPLEGPPPPVSADKQQRLHELLGRYQADQLTPEQYHQERAKILESP